LFPGFAVCDGSASSIEIPVGADSTAKAVVAERRALAVPVVPPESVVRDLRAVTAGEDGRDNEEWRMKNED
jgi:hypothetical protein